MRKYSLFFLTLLMVMSVLIACGDDFEESSSPELTEATAVPAAPDPTSPPEPTAVAEEPSDNRSSTSGMYTHPSGSFSIDVFGEEYEEDSDGAAFYGEESAVFVLMSDIQDSWGEGDVLDLAYLAFDELPITLDDFFVYDEVEAYGDGYLTYFDFTIDGEDGEGDVYLVQSGQTIYAVVLFAADYDEVEEEWVTMLDSFTPAGTAVANPAPSNSGGGNDTPPAGEYTADSGFRPESDGFSFENYGNEGGIINLTPAEMERMFGADVCASHSNGCILTPPAKRWMDQMNGYMDGGHCEGMAVLSSLMYYQQIDPANFGGNITHDLALSNELLQREIAYWWVTQGTYPGGVQKVNESPTAVVNALIDTFNQGLSVSEWWAMGIYQSDYSGGHAITPFAVEDMGGGIYHVMVYDNNWPGDTRFVEVNTNDDTWQYQASTNPNEASELYDGDADLQNLEIVAISPRLQAQQCQFCADGGSASGRSSGLAAFQLDAQYNEIWLEGDTDLLIVDENGRRLGFADGEFVNEIPGAEGKNMRFLQGTDVWDVDNEPVYRVPTGVQFSITVDAMRQTAPTTSTVTMIGPGYNLVVADIYLDAGTQDVITVSPDGSELSYQTEYNDAPDMIFGVETPAADYEFIVAALDIESGAQFFVQLDIEQGYLSINTRNTTEYGTYEVVMYRVDDDGEQWFNNNDIYMEPNDTAYMNFLEWEGPGDSIYIDIDYGSDGSIDETIELLDEFGSEE